MERRLAAVLFSDVVGYSKLMGQDEVRTHEVLKSIFSELVAPKTSQYGGRLIRLIGDGQLMEFPSVVDAVTFAVDTQIHLRKRNEEKQKHERIEFRIGINIGDVIIEPDDIYGDGVNIAARLQELAEPGGICLSQSAYDQVFDKLDLDIEELGRFELKNISRPVDTYSVALNDKASACFTPVKQIAAAKRKTNQDIILIFHGFHSPTSWQTWIPELLRGDETADIKSTGINFMSWLQFLMPGLSPRRQLREIRQAILSARAAYPENAYKLSILAHDYATDAVTSILRENPHLTIDNLLLCRSIVHPKFDWEWVSSQVKGEIVNDCATRDRWPLMVRALNWRFGATGTYGFHSPQVKDRFHAVAHRDLISRKFVKKFWTPFFQNTKITKAPRSRSEPEFPGYFWWLDKPLKVAFGTVAAFTLFLAVGMIQFLINDLNLNRNNVICRCLRVLATAPNEINVGGIAHFSKDSGALSRWAIQRSVDVARSSGRYTFKPNLFLRDSLGERDVVLEALSEFRAANVVAVVGPMTSELAYYAKKWGNQTKTPLITANASASYLVLDREGDYFFRVSMSDELRVKALVEWMIGIKQNLSPYIIHEWKTLNASIDEPQSYGMQQAEVAVRNMPKAALETTTIRFTRHDKESMATAAARVINDPNRPIAIFGYTDNIVYIIRQLHDRGIKNRIYLTGTYNKKIAEAEFPFAQNIHVISDVISEEGYSTSIAYFKREYDEDDKRPNFDPVIISAFEKAGKNIESLNFDVVAAYAYDATSIALDAMQAAINKSCLGNIDGRLVARALRSTESKQRKIVHSGFLHNRQEMYIDLDRYKIGDVEVINERGVVELRKKMVRVPAE